MLNIHPVSKYFSAKPSNLEEDAWADICTALTELEWLQEGAQVDPGTARIISQAWRAVRVLQSR